MPAHPKRQILGDALWRDKNTSSRFRCALGELLDIPRHIPHRLTCAMWWSYAGSGARTVLCWQTVRLRLRSQQSAATSTGETGAELDANCLARNYSATRLYRLDIAMPTGACQIVLVNSAAGQLISGSPRGLHAHLCFTASVDIVKIHPGVNSICIAVMCAYVCIHTLPEPSINRNKRRTVDFKKNEFDSICCISGKFPSLIFFPSFNFIRHTNPIN